MDLEDRSDSSRLMPFEVQDNDPRTLNYGKSLSWPYAKADEHKYPKLREVWSDKAPNVDINFIDGMVDGNQQIRHDQTFMSGGTNHERTPLLGSTSDAWLTNYLPKDMPSMRVSVGGFNVLDSGSDFKSVVENFAKDILNNWTLNKRPVIFVAHSLGCLIVETLYLLPSIEDLKQHVKGVLFLAPPHFGNDMAAWNNFGVHIARIYDSRITPGQIKDFQDVNQKFDSFLKQDRRKSNSTGSKIFCLYENAQDKHKEPVVPVNSVKLISSRYEEIESDHVDMINFNERKGQNYTKIVTMIRQLSNGAHSVSSIDGREAIFERSDITSSMKLVVIRADLGYYKDAEETLTTIVEDVKNNTNLDRQVWFFYQEKLASVLRKRGDYNGAFDLGTAIMRVKRSHYTHDPPTTLYSIGELCLTLQCQDKLQEAFHVLRQSFELFDTEPFDTMRSTRTVSVFARICEDSGAYKLSEFLARDVLSAANAYLEQGHQYISTRKIYLSAALATNGHVKAAKLCSQQAFDSIRRAQGKSHPNAVLATEALGNCFRYNNEFGPACQLLEQSVHHVQRQFSIHAPEALKSQGALAAVYALQGYTGESKSMLRHIAKEQNKVLGVYHRNSIWAAQALGHLDNLESNQTADHTSWTSMKTKTCKEALKFFANPQRPCKAIDMKTTKQHWQESPIDKVIDLLSTDQEEKLKNTLRACTKPIEFGSLLRLAAACGYPDAVETLLDHSVPIDSKGGFYGTALQAACAAQSYDLARTLIQRKANVNATGGIFGTPLRAAVFHGDKELVRLLLDVGADPTVQDQKLTSVLQIALAFAHLDIALLLLNHSPQLATVPDLTYGDPLQEACAKGYLEVVRALLAHGSEPATTGGLFGSPINAARENGHEEIVLELSSRMMTMVTVENSQVEKVQPEALGHLSPVLTKKLTSMEQRDGAAKAERPGKHSMRFDRAKSFFKFKPLRKKLSHLFQSSHAKVRSR